MENQNTLWGNIFSGRKKSAELTKFDILKKIPFFEDLTNRELKKASEIIYERKYKIGEYMFETDQPGAALFIITGGIVSIIIPGMDGREVEVARLKTGAFLGELALLDDSPRSASAKIIEATTALAFFRADFNKLIDQEPAIGSKILRNLAMIIGERLKATNEKLFAKEG